MSVTVKLPDSLSHLSGGKKTVECKGENVSGLLKCLEEQFPGIIHVLCDERGELRGFVNVFVNGENIRYLRGMDTNLRDSDEVTLMPAIAGG